MEDLMDEIELPVRAELYRIAVEPTTGCIVLCWRVHAPWRFVPEKMRNRVRHPVRMMVFTRMHWSGYVLRTGQERQAPII